MSRTLEQAKQYWHKYKLTPIGRALALVRYARMRAKRNGDACTITYEHVLPALERGTCDVTGLPFEMNAPRQMADSPSIDRIDPDKGYTPQNIQVVLWAYNSMRGNWGDAKLRQIIKAMPDNLPKRKFKLSVFGGTFMRHIVRLKPVKDQYMMH